MSAAAKTASSEPTLLPLLRADIVFELMAERGRSFPSVLVTDPVRGSYFRLSWPQSGILLLWRESATLEQLRSKLMMSYGIIAQAQDIANVAQFAFANQLTQNDRAGGWRRLAQVSAASQHGWFMTLVHGCLFFRIPLVSPDNFLQPLRRHSDFLYARSFWMCLAAIAAVGTYFASRQWTALAAEAHDVFKLQGLFIYAASILALKAVHEFGHALTTARHGCRVASMGVAVMVGAPVLYTDTSDSWRLARRSDRLAIVFAGVIAEMVVASVAIFLWPFLPDGLGRHICFALATSSVALSLAVNLNPFMRYDGYFALSDYLGVPNLQSRSFRLATWKLREVLFQLGRPSPESFSAGKTRVLISYAILTMIYRVSLYLGIAALVYEMGGKAIGIVLGLFEVVMFLALPVAREVAQWWTARRAVAVRRFVVTASCVSAALALIFVPWMSSLEAPAVLVAGREEAIYLPFAARLTHIEVREGQSLEAGAILFMADASELNQLRRKALLEQRSLEFQANRSQANIKLQADRLLIASRLDRARAALAAIDRQLKQLVIRAPFSGKIVDLDPEISTGLWLNQSHPLARLISNDGLRVRGLITGAEIDRVKLGAAAVFVPDDAAAARSALTVAAIAPSSDGRLAEPALADVNGGEVGATSERGEFKTKQSWFEVELSSAGATPTQLQRGIVKIESESTSPFLAAWRQVARVLVREQGF